MLDFSLSLFPFGLAEEGAEEENGREEGGGVVGAPGRILKIRPVGSAGLVRLVRQEVLWVPGRQSHSLGTSYFNCGSRLPLLCLLFLLHLLV